LVKPIPFTTNTKKLHTRRHGATKILRFTYLDPEICPKLGRGLSGGARASPVQQPPPQEFKRNEAIAADKIVIIRSDFM